MLHRKLTILSLLAAMACTGTVDENVGNDDPPAPEDDPLLGAGDRDITSNWPDIDLPYSQNTKMLSFSMLKNEVLRATAHTWVDGEIDMWEANRSALGGADYVNIFQPNRTITQQKIVTIRKMALSVCEDVVAADTLGEPILFTLQSPSAAIADDATTRSQVELIYKRFFLVNASSVEVDESIQLLSDLAGTDGPTEAWRGLCAAYLSSMRFLTY